MEEMEFSELFELLESNRLRELREKFSEMPFADTAEFIMSVESEKTAVKLFRILSKDISAEVFAYLDADRQEAIVNSITDSEIAMLMDELFVDDAVDFLEEVPANVVSRVLRNTDRETREIINRFLEYPENSAGSVMTC